MTPNIQFQSGAIDAVACIGNAWELLKQNYGIFLGISILAIILTGCIPCLNIFLMGPVLGGVFYVALRSMRNEPLEFGMMFKGFEKFVPLMVIGLIQSIPGVIAQIIRFTVDLGQYGVGRGKYGTYDFFQASDRDVALAGGLMVIVVIVAIAFMIFSIIWWAVFFFAIPLAMEYDLGPMDAIKLSARAAMSNVGGLVVLLIFQVMVMIVGMLMLCIGVFLISIPIMYLANAFAYRQVFPWMEQRFNMAPPPPTAYGSGYGGRMQ